MANRYYACDNPTEEYTRLCEKCNHKMLSLNNFQF